jgi:MFS family permease
VAIPGGLLGERFGDKRVVMLSMALMACGGALAGVAQSYPFVLAGRLVSGIGAAFVFVLMTKMLADWFAGKELFLGMSIFIIGWPIGIAVAQATQGRLAAIHTWHVVFYSTAALLILALAAMAFYRRPPEVSRGLSSDPPRLSRREIGYVCIAGAIWMFLNAAYLVMLSFGPTLLIERGMAITEAGEVVSLMSWVFVVGSRLGRQYPRS